MVPICTYEAAILYNSRRGTFSFELLAIKVLLTEGLEALAKDDQKGQKTGAASAATVMGDDMLGVEVEVRR